MKNIRIWYKPNKICIGSICRKQNSDERNQRKSQEMEWFSIFIN